MTEFFITLWPPASPFFEDIIREIGQSYEILDKNLYVFDKGEFKKFMMGMYVPDKTPKTRLKRKYNAMKRPDMKVCVLKVNVPNATMVPHKKSRLKGKYYCREMKSFKKQLRETWASKVEGYIYDIVVHIGDNEDHNKRTIKLLRRHAKRIN